jgi:hypothetical protein
MAEKGKVLKMNSGHADFRRRPNDTSIARGDQLVKMSGKAIGRPIDSA